MCCYRIVAGITAQGIVRRIAAPVRNAFCTAVANRPKISSLAKVAPYEPNPVCANPVQIYGMKVNVTI
jgi:hypothetical protein